VEGEPCLWCDHQLLRGSSPHASLDGFVWKGNRAFGGHQLLSGSSPHASLDGFVCKGNRAFGGHQLLRGSPPHASLDGFVCKGNRAFGGHQLLRGSSPHASLDGFVCKGNRAFGGHQLLRGSPPHASLDGFVCGGRERSPSLDLLERRMRSAANKRKTTGETLHPSDDTPGVPPPGSSTRSRCAKGTVASEGDYDLSLRMGTLRTGPGSFYKLNGRLVSKAIPG
jgi:hypothetical protein